MHKVHIKNTEMSVETISLRSILVALQLSDVQIKTHCGGRAVCGQCAVRILKGHRRLSPRTPMELAKLKSMAVDENIRLACQTYAGGDIDIEILNMSPGK